MISIIKETHPLIEIMKKPQFGMKTKFPMYPFEGIKPICSSLESGMIVGDENLNGDGVFGDNLDMKKCLGANLVMIN